jgi:DNA-binding XRE family transcriptional regulator
VTAVGVDPAGAAAPRPREFPPRRTVSPQVAEMLAAARRGRGLSIRQAAGLIGCAPGTVVHLEKGRRAPSLITARAVIAAYRLGPDAAALLLADAVHDAGKCSPYRAGAKSG